MPAHRPGVSAVAALPGDTLAAALMLKTFGTVSVDGKVSDADLNYLESIADSGSQDVDKKQTDLTGFCPCRTDHRCGRCAGH